MSLADGDGLESDPEGRGLSGSSDEIDRGLLLFVITPVWYKILQVCNHVVFECFLFLEGRDAGNASRIAGFEGLPCSSLETMT